MGLFIDAEEVRYVPAVGYTSDAAAIPSSTTSVISIIKKLYATLIGLVTSTLVLTETGGTITTDGTEQDVYINNAPFWYFCPKDSSNRFHKPDGG